MTEDNYGDWPDEYGNVVCANCKAVNDLPDGRKTTECWNCGMTIDADTGEIVSDDSTS